MVHQFLVDNYYDHVFMILYILNLILLVAAYKLGFAQKIPILKSVIVYILLAIGTIIVALFSLLKLPTVESLVVIVLVLGIYRFRLHKERNANKVE